MNKTFTLLLLLGCFMYNAQAQDRIIFTYDNAGNQIQRSLCLNCTTSKTTSVKPKEIVALKEEDLQKFFPEDVISYYPNPVKEELYLKWELMGDDLVTSIQVYGLSGQLLKSYSGLEKNNTQNIPFQGYPSGVYAVILFYKNGEQKTIKIIKK
ncbi:T9SS type A sorting domain-containing protein [Flavobacterium sp. XS2P39]|uniref:T9SS type A sorting domain-containing protein n=1 Tax=Flavobacterium sp. XS2P39 TaxID=3401725 RepID=UPI003AAA7D96